MVSILHFFFKLLIIWSKLIEEFFSGICQRDISIFYNHIEKEKFDIQTDIKSLFMEKIKNEFPPDNCMK